MKRLAVLLFLALPFAANAQMSNDDVHKYDHTNQLFYRNEIVIPGFDGYMTLKCDFHIHTCFSDGTVWPNVRVDEAWQEGLDAIAMTDHLEYRPFKDIVKADHNEWSRQSMPSPGKCLAQAARPFSCIPRIICFSSRQAKSGSSVIPRTLTRGFLRLIFRSLTGERDQFAPTLSASIAVALP